jgi:hypothetical protein
MAKFCNTSAIDAALTWIANRSKKMVVLTGVPGNLAACTAATYICMTTMNTGIGGGDYSLGAGAPSGRLMNIAAQSTLACVTTGVAAYVVLFGTEAGNSGINYYTTCAAATVQSTNDKVTIPTWNINISDAT